MQRHFSNRGEALAEMAAAKMMAHRIPIASSGERRSSITPGQWKRRDPEIDSPSPYKEKKKIGGGKESGRPSVVLPEL